ATPRLATRSWIDPSSPCPARSEPASGAHGPALREASLRAEPTGLPCAKRACERSPRACPARSEPASGAHGFLLRMTVRLGQTRSQTSRSTNNFAENVQVTAREHVAIVVLLGKGATSPTQLGAELRIGAQVFDRA